MLQRIRSWLRPSRRGDLPLRPYRDQGSLEDTLKREGYFSQYGQDKWIVECVFRGRRNGVFVDVGAHDGVSFSNTCYLEKELGWTGLAVEPNPDIYERLRRNRSCVAVQACVGSGGGTVRFRVISGYAEMLSGVIDEYDPRHLERIEQELQEHGGEVTDIEVPCLTLDDLLESNGISEVDYLSIDVEGSERSILGSLDFDRFAISVIGIENNYRDESIRRLLEENGYLLHAIVGDHFYVNTAAAVTLDLPGMPPG